MIVNGKEVVVIELYARGSYSGAEEAHFGFMLKEDYEKYKEEIHRYTPYFPELDGKYSEVEGEVLVYEDFNEFAEAYVRCTDNYKFTESLLESITDNYTDCHRLRLVDAEYAEMCKLSMTCSITIRFGDENAITF